MVEFGMWVAVAALWLMVMSWLEHTGREPKNLFALGIGVALGWMLRGLYLLSLYVHGIVLGWLALPWAGFSRSPDFWGLLWLFGIPIAVPPVTFWLADRYWASRSEIGVVFLCVLFAVAWPLVSVVALLAKCVSVVRVVTNPT